MHTHICMYVCMHAVIYVVCKYGIRVGGRNVSGFKVCEDFLWLPIVYSFSLRVDIRL